MNNLITMNDLEVIKSNLFNNSNPIFLTKYNNIVSNMFFDFLKERNIPIYNTRTFFDTKEISSNSLSFYQSFSFFNTDIKDDDEKKFRNDFAKETFFNFLHTFIGKDKKIIENILSCYDFNDITINYYREKGFLALNTKEKKILNLLENPLDKNLKYLDFFLFNDKTINYSYLLKHRNEIFKNVNFKLVDSKIEKFESEYNNESIVDKKNRLLSKVFIIKFLCLLTQNKNNDIPPLFDKYSNVLKQYLVKNFFQLNKYSFMKPYFILYMEKLTQFKELTFNIEEKKLNLISFKLNMTDIENKYLINNDKVSKNLTKLLYNIQQIDGFENSHYKNLYPYFELYVCHEHSSEIDKIKNLISEIINNKEIFMQDESYLSLYKKQQIEKKLIIKPSSLNKI